MKYVFPAGFDLPRALQLAGLVNCAYNQIRDPGAWKLPDGFVLLPPALSSKEYWKFGPLSEMLEERLPTPITPVPFGFVGHNWYRCLRGDPRHEDAVGMVRRLLGGAHAIPGGWSTLGQDWSWLQPDL